MLEALIAVGDDLREVLAVALQAFDAPQQLPQVGEQQRNGFVATSESRLRIPVRSLTYLAMRP